MKMIIRLLGILFVCFLLPCGAMRSSAQSFLTSGLAAYYPFNGNANDASGNGNNGTVQGATLTTNRFGIPNSAYYFTGNFSTYISIPDSPSLDITNNVTVSVWIQTGGGGYTGPDIVGKYNYFLGLSDTSSSPKFEFGIQPSTGVVFSPSFPLNPNNWVFATGTYDGQLIDIYINGILAGQLAASGTIGNKHEPLGIGENLDDGSDYVLGSISDVRIYNRALSSNEVAQLYAYESTTHPRTATGTATLAGGFVVGVNLNDNGYGYTNTPIVQLIGGGGSGAQAVAVVSNGIVTTVNVLNAGFGYTNAPVVVIEPPLIYNPVLGIAPMSSLAFSNLTVGVGYQLQQFVNYYWANLPINFTATNTINTLFTAGLGGEYRLALTPVPTQAFANPQVVNGFVVGATVTNHGSGYLTIPAVNIYGDVGSNATAVASISGGTVTGITITDAGIGYTNMVTVQIDPPPVPAVSPTMQLVMRVDSSSLAPYHNYQLQFMPDITGTWMNWNSGLFSPTAATNSQFIFITNSTGYFRLQFVQ
jgi:hypothetical protein